MEPINEQRLAMLANEAFIRRAAIVNMPFMLKGSYITRQYLPGPDIRYANDLDWVYMGNFSNPDDAHAKLSAWVTAVTETFCNDGVVFQSFTQNPFWRMIDYAMADDFPTVNTDLLCWVNGEEYDWYGLDVSFNLDIEPGPVPLQYQPISGPAFNVPYTCPLALQVAWKLHQLLVRPRFKDIFDLTYLVSHPEFNDTTRQQTLQALVNECKADNIDPEILNWYISDNISLSSARKRTRLTESIHMHDAKWTTPAIHFIPDNVTDLLQHLRKALRAAGFTDEILEQLPAPTRASRKSYTE